MVAHASLSYSSLFAQANPSASRKPDPAERLLGQQLGDGRFEIRRLIGRGGMGVVYAALDRARSHEVALKLLHWADPRALSRMKQEFRALADVVHPNLVTLHELFATDERCFFTMDLLSGAQFHDFVRAGATPSERTARLRGALPQLLRGVDAVHRGGKLHRDLKPSNVLVTDSGQVVILDFGLACDRSGLRDLDVSEVVCGTPHYMAPEQAAGALAGPASDLYAVGVIVYEALTGRLPFTGKPLAVMLTKQAHDPRPPSELAEVDPALEALCVSLLRRDPARRPTAAAVLAELGAPLESAALSSQASAPIFLGRQAELSRLLAAFDASRRARPSLAWLEGAAGLGKSALLESLVRAVRVREPSALVFTGRCHEQESLPYKALDGVIEAIGQHLERLPEADQLALLGEHAGALARLFPSLLRVAAFASRPAPSTVDPRELRRHGERGLGELLCALGERRPLVLLIDDAQWGDDDSAHMLGVVLGAAQPPRMLLVVAHRDGALQHFVPTLGAAQTGFSDLVQSCSLSLAPLSAADAAQLARALLPQAQAGASVAEAICREAGGNPLILCELAHHAQALEQAEGGGATESMATLSLAQLVRARMERLEPSARALFEVFCVAAHPLPAPLALAATDATQASAAALRGLQQQGLLRARTSHGPDALAVYHDRVRETVRAELEPTRVTALHARLARALVAAEGDPELIARHCLLSGDEARAARYAEQAGDRATRALAFVRAVELYRMALSCRGEEGAAVDAVKRKLALALSDGGRGTEAAPLLMEAARSAAPEEALELRRRAAEQWLASGHAELGLAALSAVLREVGLRLPEGPRAAVVDLLTTRARLALRGLSFARRSAEQVPPSQLRRIDACQAAWSLSLVSTLRAAAFQSRHLLYALQAGEPSRIALGLAMESVYSALPGGSGEARVLALAGAARALSTELTDPHVEAFVHLADGQSSYLLGRWLRCSQSLAQAEEILTQRCRNVTFELNTSRFFWGNALVYRGRYRELDRRLGAWLKDARERGDLYADASLSLLRTRSVGLATGDVAAVRSDVDEAVAKWSSPEFGVQRFLAIITQVQIDLYEGLGQSAHARMRALREQFSGSLMTRIQLCRIHTHHHGAAAALRFAEANAGGARAALIAEAARHARALRKERMPWASALATLIDAAVAQAQGERERAARVLRAASEQLDSVYMHVYAASCRRKLGALLGGDEGRALVQAADEFMADQGVVAPERLAGLQAPGFG